MYNVTEFLGFRGTQTKGHVYNNCCTIFKSVTQYPSCYHKIMFNFINLLSFTAKKEKLKKN